MCKYEEVFLSLCTSEDFFYFCQLLVWTGTDALESLREVEDKQINREIWLCIFSKNEYIYIYIHEICHDLNFVGKIEFLFASKIPLSLSL